MLTNQSAKASHLCWKIHILRSPLYLKVSWLWMRALPSQFILIWRESLRAIHQAQIYRYNTATESYIAFIMWNICVHVPLDDIIEWTHFPRYWTFVRGIHRSPMNSPHKGQWCRALMFSLICLRLNKRLSKQSWGWWFETLSRPLWRYWNELVGMNSK